MESLVFADKEITLLLNSFYTSWQDLFFYLITSRIVWLPLYVALLWMIFRRQGGKGLMTLLVVGVLILLADRLTSGLMKPLFERLRPSHDPMLQYMVHIVADYRGGLYGFASSHAANTFAVWGFFSFVVRNVGLNISLGIWALLNCYGRIYQGVHFLGDIIVGALIGLLVARLVYEAYLHIVLHFFVISHHNKRTLKSGLARSFGQDEPTIVTYTFWLTIAFILIFISLLSKYYGATI